MLFTSLTYFLFLPLVFGLTYTLNEKWRVPFLVGVSYFFYALWKPSYLLVVVGLTIFDYIVGLILTRLENRAVRKAAWIASLVANLGCLFVFKYFGLFSRELAELAEILTGQRTPAFTDLLLPLGISFHTFQAISYTTDVYLGYQKAETRLLRFALFIAWFPQLVAGPIERAHHLLPQLGEMDLPTSKQVREGLVLIGWGFFKKIMIADQLSSAVSAIFVQPTAFSPAWTVVAAYAYTFQIYCDFSGYTDIARGSSLLFGVQLVKNFDRPYWTSTIPEFWRRWHISLSSWFYEYVYYPLARVSNSTLWLATSVVIVFTLSGLWHGGQVTFLIWGLIHATAYLIFVALGDRISAAKGFPRALLIFVNLQIITLGWIFFRAPNLATALTFLERIPRGFLQLGTIFNDQFFLRVGSQIAVAGVGLIMLFVVEARNIDLQERAGATWLKSSTCVAVCAALCLLLGLSFTDFIYFDF